MASELRQFNRGLNLDVNPREIPNGVYLDAHNIRLIGDTPGSSVNINNYKGNAYNISIPNTTRIKQIKIVASIASNTLTIDGQVGTAFSTASLDTYKKLYDYINNDTAYTNVGVTYNIYYGDNYLLVIPISNNTLGVTQTGGGLSINLNYIHESSNPEIIGSANIRGDIYLFVAANGGTDNKDNIAPTRSIGQIWKYVYDKINYTALLTLVYNNYINFSTYWCIAPTASQGRYENSGIQRIYWTDNYNKLRQLNVANTQSLAVDPTILDITPGVDFDIPLLTSIDSFTGPNIPVGSYQLAYRLKNTGGAVTTFSELSNQVFIADGNPVGHSSSQFKDYVGAPAGTLEGSHISWIINIVDRDFDRIEFAVIKKESLITTPEFLVTASDFPINSDSYTFTYGGDVEMVPITENEFLALSGIFTHCKTIASKDNRLFVANIRNQQSELDFDCRAFRSKIPSTNNIVLTNNGVSTSYTFAQAKALPETEDCINDYNSSNACLASPLGGFGGAGVNISYKFICIASPAEPSQSGATFEINPVSAAPWRYTQPNRQTNFIDLGVDSAFTPQHYTNVWNTGKTFGGFKYSSVNGVLKGYQRNEIYRFGIQFYDKSKNPYFVKWIGDIKMPDYGYAINNSFYEDGITPTGQIDAKLSFYANPNGVYEEFVQSLGIQWTINNLDTIADKISGYSIVRVKREEVDKDIISTGMVHRVVESTLNTERYMSTLGLSGSDSGNVVGDNAGADNTRVFYVSPNNCQDNLTGPTENMTFKIRGVLQTTNVNHTIVCLAEPNGDYYYWKNYSHVPNVLATAPTYNLDYVQSFGHGGTIIDNSSGTPITINNYDFLQNNGGGTEDVDKSHSIGNACSIFKLNGSINYTAVDGTNNKFFATVERVVPLSSKYGGATYVARAANEYISTGHFRLLPNTTLPIDDNFYSFGGDVFVNMYDSNRWSKNYEDTGRPATINVYSATFYYAAESPVNTELRYGKYMNKDFVLGGVGEFHETYTYNAIYSSEDDIRTYFPKPDPFINNDEFDNRFYASDIKINGELVDSWGLFKETNVWDVEGIYGPINAIDILADKLYFWQNRAFGIMEVNPRAVVTDVNNTSNANLQIGTGLPLQRHDYISTEIGLQHQWGVTKSSYKLFWMDVANKKFYSFGGQGLTPESDIKGMFSYFTNHLTNNILNYDKPVYKGNSIGINGIRCVYDFKYNQAIFTFTDGINGEEQANDFTLVFDESINAFVTFTDFIPKIYFGDGYKILSSNPDELEDIYMHDIGAYGTFYGTKYDSTIKFVFNKEFNQTKVFDNLKLDVQSLNNNGVNQYSDFWDSIRVYDDSQNTDFITLVPTVNCKRKERTWQLPIFRNRVINNSNPSPNIFDPANLSPIAKPFGDRIRDKYCVVDLVYNNDDDNLLVTNNVICEFRSSNR